MNKSAAVRPEGQCQRVIDCALDRCGLFGGAAVLIGGTSLLALALTATWISGSVILARAKVPSQTLKGAILLGAGVPLSALAIFGAVRFGTIGFKAAQSGDHTD